MYVNQEWGKMNHRFKILFTVGVSIALLSGCAPLDGAVQPSEGDGTGQIPDHVNQVIDQFAAGGYICENPSVRVGIGGTESDVEYARLKCNESDDNILGDRFNIFASEAAAITYYANACEGGYFVGEYMVSPLVQMSFSEKTLEQASEFSKALGYSSAQEILGACEYRDLAW